MRQSLARYLRGVLEESTPTTSFPPPPSPESTPPTTTTSTTPAISEAGTLAVVLETMRSMQEQNLRELRGMVMDILQGRPMSEAQIAAMAAAQPDPQPLRTPFDPPDYDHPGIEDLPGHLQSVFEREAGEQDTLRTLRTEREVLSMQLDQARAALADPQGPAFDPSWSTD
jgi:hypothetical protein